jgi:hypothetical protein
MRNYWLRIVLGALAIFAVGMVIAKMVRRGSLAVHQIAEGSGPISVPLPGFVPFSLDGNRLGSVRRITMYRDAPKRPSSFVVSVSLPDSVASDRLARCIILVDTSQNSAGTSADINAKTAFRCLSAADTAGKDLVPFGSIVIRSRGDSFPFLLPRKVVDEMRNPPRPRADSIAAGVADSLGAADSVRAPDSTRAAAPGAR